MIRCLLVLLLLHFSFFTLLSCSTTAETSDGSDQTASDSGAIDDGAAIADATDGDVGNGNDKGDGKSEDQLESDLDTQEPATEQAAVPKEGTSEDTLDKDLQAESPDQGTPPASDATTTADTTATPTPEPVPMNEKARIRDIRYLSNSNGGTIVIETTKPIVFQTRMNAATQQFVIEIADVDLPPALQRPYVLKDFGSRFGSINAYQGEGSSTARVVLQMSSTSSGEPIVQQEGTSLVVVPSTAAPPVASAPQTPPPSAPSDKPVSTPQGALAARTLDEFLTGNQTFYGRPISFQVKDADVRDVVNFLAEESGANVVMSDDVTGKISIKLRKIPWDQALVMVMRAKGLGYVRQGNVLRISSLKELQGETETTNKLLEAQKAIVPAVVQVIPISYTNLDELVKSVKPFLSKDGQVVGDNRSGTLIVTDKVDVVDRVVKLVKALDTAPTQVSIESKVVEADEEFESFVGVTWGMTGIPKQISSSGGYAGAPVDLTGNVQSGSLSQQFQSANPFSASVSVGTLDFFGNLTAALSLAEHDQLAKVIASPRISAINREKSTIIQQSENIVVTSTAATTIAPITKTVTRTPYKLQLDVTPQITSDGSVIMDLEILREFLSAVVDVETGAQAVNSRKAKTKVLVRNGQTAVIGGIYTSDELESTRGVPGLMNIPIIGWLFKNRVFTRDKNELLVFMTPRIISQDLNEAMPSSQIK